MKGCYSQLAGNAAAFNRFSYLIHLSPFGQKAFDFTDGLL